MRTKKGVPSREQESSAMLELMRQGERAIAEGDIHPQAEAFARARAAIRRAVKEKQTGKANQKTKKAR